MKYGRLTVLSTYVDGRWTRAICRCDCGTEKIVRLDHIRFGRTRSCGCLHRGVPTVGNRTHGMTVGKKIPPEFSAWNNMIRRCYEQDNISYARYGGRGITVCDRWRFGENGESGFACFIEDMGLKASPYMSLERIDNDVGYIPSNCRWADKKEQARNRHTNRLVFAFGRTRPLAEAIEMSGITDTCFYLRLKRGMAETEAVETPSRKKVKNLAPSSTSSND